MAIKVVAIDNGKWAIQQGAGRPNSMGSAPRLAAARGPGVALGQVIHLLQRVAYAQYCLVLRANLRFKYSGKFGTNYKDHFGKSGLHGMRHSVVNHGFAIWPHRLELFEATVALTQARSQHQQGQCRSRASADWRLSAHPIRPVIRSAALYANITVGAWVLAEVMLGNTEASITRRP